MDIKDTNFLKYITNLQKNNNKLAQASSDRAFQQSMQAQKDAQAFNSYEAHQNRVFQTKMSNTAHTREVKDLQAAGLNPVLSANNGAAVTSGASASSGQASGQKAEIDMQLASLWSNYLMNRQNNAMALKMNNINNKNAMELTKISAAAQLSSSALSAAATRYASSTSAAANKYAARQGALASMYSANASAAASRYNSDNQLTNSREQRSYDENHPSNGWQAGSSVANKVVDYFSNLKPGKSYKTGNSSAK